MRVYDFFREDGAIRVYAGVKDVNGYIQKARVFGAQFAVYRKRNGKGCAGVFYDSLTFLYLLF